MKRIMFAALVVLLGLNFNAFAQPNLSFAVESAEEFPVAADVGESELQAYVIDSGSAGENVTWTLYDTGELVISGSGKMEGYPWLDYFQKIRKVTVNPGISYIYYCAFMNCPSLTCVTLPEGLTNIDEHAFAECTSLTSITLPEGLTDIGQYTFNGCTSLTSVTLPEGLTNIDGYAFTECTSLTSITLPEGVTHIAPGTFSGCTSLASITLPERLTKIGGGAFSECTSLTSITLPDGLTEIGPWTFSGCTSLMSITLPESVDYIDDTAFGDCPVTIYGYAGSYAQEYAEKLGIPFAICHSVVSVTLSNDELTLTAGGSTTLTATVSPADATDQSVSWKSSDTSIATVENGVVTAVAPGTATITVTTADGGKTASCVVTVSEPIAEDNPTVRVSSVTGRAGETVDITVELENNPGIAVIGFDVNYDTNALALKAITAGNIFADTEVDGNLEKVPFTFNAYTGKANKTDSGILVTLQFEIKEGCEEKTYPIGVTAVEALNIDEEDVLFAVSSGAVTVRNVIPGDVNGDGTVARSDLLRLAKYFAGHSVEIDQAAADVTGDGKLARADLLRLAKYFAGHSVVLGK